MNAHAPPAPGAGPNRDPEGRRDEAEVAAFVEMFGATLAASGMPRLPARIVPLMLADEDGRMTSAEICAALSVSPAAVSGAMSFLHGYGFVRKERLPGGRRDVYVLQTDVWHTTTLHKTAVIEYLADQLERGLHAVGGPTTQAGRRVALSVEFYRFVAEATADLIERWELRRAELLRGDEPTRPGSRRDQSPIPLRGPRQ